MRATKSPLTGVADQQAYERLLPGLGASEMYRIPLSFEPAALPRGIAIDPGKSQHVNLVLFQDIHSVCFQLLRRDYNLFS